MSKATTKSAFPVKSEGVPPKFSVWLADLTHTGQSIASDAVPAAVGMIAEALAQECKQISDIKIFKFPEDLETALGDGPPHIFGLSNYVWNFRLARAFGTSVKKYYPETVVVVGGPNYPSDSEEQEVFLRNNPWIDFYIEKEGELAFVSLVDQLSATNCNKFEIDYSGLTNLSFITNDVFQKSEDISRVNDLNNIPSPYLSGRLKRFLDGRLMPVIQTNRGCPFTCAFCTEGQGYWGKVKKKSSSTIRGEIRYIAQELAKLPADVRRSDLLIADSNFGMFPDDLNTCDVIREVQDAHSYPSYINVATGKNKKERVLEAARRVRGAMKLAGSVQSLDPEVQAQMKRSNISSDEIVALALEASEIGTNTYSEVILALPGDTKEKHYQTLKTLVDSDFSTLSMYQLMVLPGTEFGSVATKAKFGMKTKYRVIPRAFGTYTILGKKVSVAEIEEICVENSTLPYRDYLQCRRMNLMVNIFFNDRVFDETLMVIRWLGESVFEFLSAISESKQNLDFEKFVSDFLAETEEELWSCEEELTTFVEGEENIARFVSGELGSNLIFKFKARSLTSDFAAICTVLLDSIEKFCSERDVPIAAKDLLKDTVTFKRCQVEGIFLDSSPFQQGFNFPLLELPELLSAPPSAQKLATDRACVLEFGHDSEQLKNIESYKNVFGCDLPGLTRILTRARITDFYRHVSEVKDKESAKIV